MEFYAPAQTMPSMFADLQITANDPGARRTVFSSSDSDSPDVLHFHHHAAPSQSGLGGDATGLHDAMWQMTLQSNEEMDATDGPFPERPDEPDCAYYMRTGLCAFGMSCRFNHPSKRKLAAAIAWGKEEYPERSGQPECQYYLKTGTCRFGAACKYHHPRDKAGSLGRTTLNVVGLPLRPGEKDCAYYMRTGTCKFGMTCKFNHPQLAAAGTLMSMAGSPLYAAAGSPSTLSPQPFPAGLQAWPIARSPFMPGPSLQGPSSFTPLILPPQGVVSVPRWSTYQGQVGSLASLESQHQSLGTNFVYGAAPRTDTVAVGIHGTFASYVPGSSAMRLTALQTQSSSVNRETPFPERFGQPECQYYMKTGNCKFGMACRYHHPKEISSQSSNCVLSPMGLPLRLGAPLCTFYNHYGICKFGPTCKFDHPMGGLSYSPSASSLADMPVAPYPIGSSPATLAPSSEAHVLAPQSTSRESVGASERQGPLQRHSLDDHSEETLSSSIVITAADVTSLAQVSSTASMELEGSTSQSEMKSSK